MKSLQHLNPVALALYANAALLSGILVVLLSHGLSASPAAFGAQAQQAPIGGGGGLYVVPGQIHPGVWGCYLLDTDRQTLCVYEYEGGSTNLTLKAARNVYWDLRLRNYNTTLPWYDVQKLVEDEANDQRGSATRPSGAMLNQ